MPTLKTIFAEICPAGDPPLALGGQCTQAVKKEERTMIVDECMDMKVGRLGNDEEIEPVRNFEMDGWIA